jgi:uncharacterized protein YfdQ (DUF2303 family)
MSDDQLDETAVIAAADLGRRAVEAQSITLNTGETKIDSSLIARVVRDDEDVELHDLEKYLTAPRRARGSVRMHDPVSFAAYVTRLAPADKATSLWTDDQARTIVAVFNDHVDTFTPGWRDHTATLTVRVDPDWSSWISRNGSLIPQVQFGEFLENHLHVIVDPPAADLVMIAKTLVGKRNLSFESSVKWETSDVVFEYREVTKAEAGGKAGKVEIPKSFTIWLAPFVGAAPVEMVARLRYDVSRECLSLGYQLTRPDRAEKEAFERIVAQVGENTPEGVPVLFGTAPESLRR